MVRLLADGVDPRWLTLREGADAAARAADLVDRVRAEVVKARRGRQAIVVHDLGCGTGSMLRWLAPQLPGPQRWVLHDRDTKVLAHAARNRVSAADATAVDVETRVDDVTGLAPGELRGAHLVTASALLDLLTAGELEHLAVRCLEPVCPVLLTLTVTGGARLDPAHPLDAVLADAFDAHQRRVARGGRLLGPDAGSFAAGLLAGPRTRLELRPTPWQLGPDDGELVRQWLSGWLGAACRQEPALAGEVPGYLRRRRRDLAEGRLRVTVRHEDLLVVPRAAAPSAPAR